MSKPTIAIIGRTNVGKSTLFNKLLSKPTALITPVAGTTRDRLEANCSWQGFDFTIIDTGGFDINKQDKIERKILDQTNKAITAADLILLVVDVIDGSLPQDKEFILYLKKLNKNMVLVANKADNLKKRQAANEFYQLGVGVPVPVSAANGSGIGDLLDIIVKKLKLKKSEETSEAKKPRAKPIVLIFLGQPNVGKSSIINSILNEERVIVSQTPHTTRGVQTIDFVYKNKQFQLLDTAGLRRRKNKSNIVEKFSINQVTKILPVANVAILVLDISQRITVQDKKIAHLIIDNNVNIVIAANKWDLIPEKDDKTVNKYIKYLYYQLPLINFAPIIFTSAKEKQRVRKILDLAIETYKDRFKNIDDDDCEKFLKWAIKKNQPTKGGGTKYPNLISFNQVAVNPPTFLLKKDAKSTLASSYIKYLIKQLRNKFGFLGTPVRIILEKVDLSHKHTLK